jgi:hypothetical protein
LKNNGLNKKEKKMFEGKIGKEMMIEQGYVPKTCTLPEEIAGSLIWSEINKGLSPCDGCNAERAICQGGPKDPNYCNAGKKLKKLKKT